MDPERNKKAIEVRQKLFGDYHPNDSQVCDELAPDYLALARETIFGGIWSRPDLDMKSRSMVVLAIQTVLQRWVELRLHIRGALNLGLTKQQIIEVFMQCGFYAGIPVGKIAITMAKEVFEEFDREAKQKKAG
jgi:4-carboxymuconolactone decarboxylase